MIAYDLQCNNGHHFEGWFEGSDAFDQQNAQGLIACPVCEDCAVIKIPSTFSIKGATHSLPRKPDGTVDTATLGRQIVDYVNEHFDNVGADFAQEALKMHYGVSAPRNIRGVSTPTEEATLKSEGIQFFKIPIPSEPPETDPDKS